MHFAEQPVILQQLQRAVDRHQSDAGIPAVQPGVNVRRRQVLLAVSQDTDNRPALRGQPESTPLQFYCYIPVSHLRQSTVENDFQLSD